MTLESLILLGTAITISYALSRRLKLLSPIVLIVAGVAISFVPHAGDIELPHEVVLSIFLPLLLYWESLSVSLNQVRRGLRGIILSGTVLVAITALLIALVGSWMGLSIGTALLIGACLGPTDATAVSALGRGMSSGQKTVLQAESLINDGSALVIFAVALQVTGGTARVTTLGVTQQVFLSFGGGVLVGIAMGLFVLRVLVRRGLFQSDAILANIARILTPLLAYYLAEEIQASGVIAVVVCGMLVSRFGESAISLASRVIAIPVWTLLTFILNSVLFIMVGLELPVIIRGLDHATLVHGLILIPVIYLAVVFARLIGHHAIIYSIRLLDRRPEQKQRRTNFRGRLVTTVAGFRGAISLAMALSIPSVFGDSAFEDRDLILLIVAGAVILSLVIQGPLLPIVVRWAAQKPAPESAYFQTANNEVSAMLTVLKTAADNVEAIANAAGIEDKQLIDNLREEILTYVAHGEEASSLDELLTESSEERQLRLALTQFKRDEMTRLRDRGEIEQETWRTAIDHIDVELLRLSGPIELEE